MFAKAKKKESTERRRLEKTLKVAVQAGGQAVEEQLDLLEGRQRTLTALLVEKSDECLGLTIHHTYDVEGVDVVFFGTILHFNSVKNEDAVIIKYSEPSDPTVLPHQETHPIYELFADTIIGDLQYV